MGERFSADDVHPSFGGNNADQAIEMVPRPSFQDNRRDPLGRLQPASKRGSAVDSKLTFPGEIQPTSF